MALTFWEAYGPCAGGVILSALIPSLSRSVRQYFVLGGPAGVARSHLLKVVWKNVKPYATLGAFSLAVSILIVAFLGDKLTSWQTALLAGYLWDSTLQKIVRG